MSWWQLGGVAVRALAPQFLALVLLNALFLVLLFWFVDGRARHTAALIAQLMASCPELRH